MAKTLLKNDVFEIQNSKSVVTIGTFDGIHLAHKNIIKKLVDTAKTTDSKSIVFSFSNHPRAFFSKKDFKIINTTEQKIEIINSLNVDILILKVFDKMFANLSAEQFIKNQLIDKLKMHTLVIGDDHKFGKDRDGSLKNLKILSKKYNFKIIQINSIFAENTRVSSTNVRKAISEGKIEFANKLLGYNYFFDGKVISGSQIGRNIGFPTANIELNSQKLLPNKGVYTVLGIIDGKKHKGMANIGYRPSINLSKTITLEVHFFNFNKNIYKKNVRIVFLKRIRNEMKFNSKNELIEQLLLDKKKSLTSLNNIEL